MVGRRHSPTSRAPPTRFPASRRTTRRRPSRAPACPALSPASSREPTERASVLAPSRPRRASQYRAPDAKTSYENFRSSCIGRIPQIEGKSALGGHVDTTFRFGRSGV